MDGLRLPSQFLTVHGVEHTLGLQFLSPYCSHLSNIYSDLGLQCWVRNLAFLMLTFQHILLLWDSFFTVSSQE